MSIKFKMINRLEMKTYVFCNNKCMIMINN